MTVVPIIINEPAVRKYVQDYTPSEHDYQVLALINRVINEKYYGTLRNRGGSELATVSYVLEKCQVPEATRSLSGDTVGRDAEYYFKSRWVVACHKGMFGKVAEAVWMDWKNLAYNLLKMVAFAFHMEKHLQSDSGAVTPPGGIFWGFKGALDGVKDIPNALMKPSSPELPAPVRPIQIA